MRQFGVSRWTNESVRRFAENGDPIEVMTRKVREIVLKARDAGWDGPPFNPVELARQMDIRVEASAAVPDARTVVDERGARIEYNPQQRRARARFSIAHEIVHTFFPDVGDAVRNRGGDPSSRDDWQLELLCNLGASEIVMPVGSLPKLDEVPSLEKLIEDRLQFDVSTEAYLIRIVSVTDAPITMFIASPHQLDQSSEYRIDYAIASSSAPQWKLGERSIPEDSVVRQCTAIGSTAHGLSGGRMVSRRRSNALAFPGILGASFRAWPGSFVMVLVRATTSCITSTATFWRQGRSRPMSSASSSTTALSAGAAALPRRWLSGIPTRRRCSANGSNPHPALRGSARSTTQ